MAACMSSSERKKERKMILELSLDRYEQIEIDV